MCVCVCTVMYCPTYLASENFQVLGVCMCVCVYIYMYVWCKYVMLCAHTLYYVCECMLCGYT